MPPGKKKSEAEKLGQTIEHLQSTTRSGKTRGGDRVPNPISSTGTIQSSIKQPPVAATQGTGPLDQSLSPQEKHGIDPSDTVSHEPRTEQTSAKQDGTPENQINPSTTVSDPRTGTDQSSSVQEGNGVEHGTAQSSSVQEGNGVEHGIANPAPPAEVGKLPSYIYDYLLKLETPFQKFWTKLGNFPREFKKETNKDLEKLHREHGNEILSDLGKIDFEDFEEIKNEALGFVLGVGGDNEEVLLEAWKMADIKTNGLLDGFSAAGFPEHLVPPRDWIERCTRLKRPTGKSPSMSPESRASAPAGNASSEGQQGPTKRTRRDRTIQALEGSCGVTEWKLEDVVGYSRRGGACEVLVFKEKHDSLSYWLVSGKDVAGFDNDRPQGISLVREQRPLREKVDGKTQWLTGKDVIAMEGVVWREKSYKSDEDPLRIISSIKPSRGERNTFPVTRVLTCWKDGEKTWETRTTLRSLKGREKADKLIYQAAKCQEKDYAGIPDEPQNTESPSDHPRVESKVKPVAIIDEEDPDEGSSDHSDSSADSSSETASSESDAPRRRSNRNVPKRKSRSSGVERTRGERSSHPRRVKSKGKSAAPKRSKFRE